MRRAGTVSHLFVAAAAVQAVGRRIRLGSGVERLSTSSPSQIAARRVSLATVGSGILLVVVVEDLERVVAAVAHAVQARHQVSRPDALCTPSPGKTRNVRAVAMRSSTVRTSFHM